MKIWIDLINSPHINFFKPFIKKWEEEGNEVIITARNLANTIDLIEQNRWNYTEIGGHAGKNIIMKMFYFPLRVLQLCRFLNRTKPDIGISQSSFYSPVAGKLVGIPTIYLNDNEHAKGNYIAFKFASLSIIPFFLKAHAESNSWHKKFNMDYYPGIKEGIYLSQFSFSNSQEYVDENDKQIFIRLEPWTAQYYNGKRDFMDKLILHLKNKYYVTILPRSFEQAKHYQSSSFDGVKVAIKPIPLEVIVRKCRLFIGAGGSMTRELAYLGIPTISVYQDVLLEVDKYLINSKYMYYLHSPTLGEIETILSSESKLSNEDLTIKGTESFSFINQKVYDYAKN